MERDEGIVEIHLKNSDIMDWSAIEALNVLGERYAKKTSVEDVKFLSIKHTSKSILLKANEIVHKRVLVDEEEECEVEEGGRHLNVVERKIIADI